MDSSYDADGIRIFDRVLGATEFRELQLWAERVAYQSVHHDRWRPVWRLGEGDPLRGPTWSTSSAGSLLREGQVAEGAVAALEPLAAILRQLLLFGRPTTARISLTPWIYPQGTALGLHLDDGDFDGSFIFYSIPEWDVHWGGLLHCVTDLVDATFPPRAILDPTCERLSTMTPGRGIWISPVRNRLVTLSPHVRHFISRVDVNAGDRPRTSIGGFVLPGMTSIDNIHPNV